MEVSDVQGFAVCHGTDAMVHCAVVGLGCSLTSLDLSANGMEADALAHIEWAKWPDVVCVAPLTANTMAKLACGLADDALTTVLMATTTVQKKRSITTLTAGLTRLHTRHRLPSLLVR